MRSTGRSGFGPGAEVSEDLLDERPLDEGRARPADLAVAMFTSGSTGEPKAVLHTHRGLAHKALTMVDVHDLSSDDAVLMPAPLAHISGLLNGVLVSGAAGMRTVLMDKWDPEQGLHLIEEERVSFMIGPPALFTGLMSVPSFSRERVASMRVISTGAMGVTPEFVTAAHEGFGAFVKRSYGSTEAPTVSTTYHADDPARGRETDGRAVGQAEVRVVDPASGRDRPTGDVGEVWVRGPELFAGYADQAQTRVAIHRGWFRTGDLGVLDEGWLTIVGRIKELIIRGGEKVAPAEVERTLQAHPRIQQAVVVGYPDRRLGERVAAFVVADGGFDLGTCQAWFASQGGPFQDARAGRRGRVPARARGGKPDRVALAARPPSGSGPGRDLPDLGARLAAVWPLRNCAGTEDGSVVHPAEQAFADEART